MASLTSFSGDVCGVVGFGEGSKALGACATVSEIARTLRKSHRVSEVDAVARGASRFAPSGVGCKRCRAAHVQERRRAGKCPVSL